VHLKLESLFKEEPIMSWSEQKSRIIVWQSYAVAALFSPIFMAAKKRLKTILSSRIVYVDGMTPSEISKRVRASGTCRGFFENDLSKQDRQTDRPLLEAEFGIYNVLGVANHVMQSWQEMHNNWRYKGSYNTGWLSEMRLTGQATTSLGNAIINLLVHKKFFNQNRHCIKLMVVLGDDNTMILSEPPEIKNLRKDIACDYNMQCKESYDEKQGNFCSMMMYKDKNNIAGMGPDFVRMMYRFEVTNGVHEATPHLLEMRSMSYCMQLGAIPAVKEVIKKEKWPIEPEQWYDYHSCVNATASRYHMSYDEVELCIGKLIGMITTREVTYHSLDFFTSTAKRKS
jgi:hypothetical protein